MGAMLVLSCGGDSSAGGAPTDAVTDASATDTPAASDAATFACARGPKASAIPAACNGSEALCDRSYADVTFPMTHNAMSNSDEKWAPPNQTHGIARQLEDGIRGMMLDVHFYDPDSGATDVPRADLSSGEQTYLCHGVCALGRRPLAEGLCDVTKFLDENRGEVFSIIFESYVKPSDLAEAMTASGLVDYVYPHVRGTPWPTLRELIAKNTRVIAFTENGDDTPPWNLSAWKDIWDTPYSFTSASEYTCALNRGQTTNALFLINHWIGNPLSDIKYAREVNVKSVLGPRVQQCTTEAGRRPTFVGVDFYDVGDLFQVVRESNGL
jgi:hypothetical protein